MAAGDGLGAPLVLTLEMDGAAFAQLDELRRRHYAPERNLVPAHLTMFHQLPGEHAREIKALLRRAVAGWRPIDLQVTEVKAMERGVALFLRSPQLSSLREMLAAEWWPWLAEQDRAGYRPHVTIASAASPSEARSTQRAVAATLRLSTIRGLGLHLWRYRGGSWEDLQLFRFAPAR